MSEFILCIWEIIISSSRPRAKNGPHGEDCESGNRDTDIKGEAPWSVRSKGDGQAPSFRYLMAVVS